MFLFYSSSFLVSFLLVNAERQRPLDISVRSATHRHCTVAPARYCFFFFFFFQVNNVHTTTITTTTRTAAAERMLSSNESHSMGCTCCYYLVEATAIKIYKTKEAVSCSPHIHFPEHPKKSKRKKEEHVYQ